MKKIFTRNTKLAFVLISLSITFYIINYVIFHDAHDIFFYLINDIAFLFLQVCLVTLVIQSILGERDKREKMLKLNMVIGTFFSEIGRELLKNLAQADVTVENLQKQVIVAENWSDKNIRDLLRAVDTHKGLIESKGCDLQRLKIFLAERRDFLLTLLSNGNLLEHEVFTNLLWAVLHMQEELDFRPTLVNLPADDYNHLSGDISRVYSGLIKEWARYMYHLRNKYPYLFSLEIRTNPFDKNADIHVKT
ncbi:MAG: hypothetical protein HQL25_07680 [Candidatus Omnitrophica bacterium]|nr:hypothetical protein [Candidatus Omnitrophota bacterium]